MEQHWLTILIVVLIVGIVFDGIRRMRNARQDSIKMSLRPVQRSNEEEDDENPSYGSEFPNGGARVSNRHIDPERIKQVRNKYNFGSDMSAWRDKVAEKIAEHTGIKNNSEEAAVKPDARIEPSFEADPLMDDVTQRHTDDNEYIDVNGDVEYETDVYEETESAIVDDEAYDAQQADIGQAVETAEMVSEEPVREQSAPEEPDREPVQASLNLEDSVPMLMDSLETETSDAPEETISSQSGKAEKPQKAEPIVPVATHITPNEAEDETDLHTHSANKPRYESKYADHGGKAAEPQEVLVIHVKAAKDEYFYGSDLLDLVLNNGLRYGAMDIFHRHAGEDGEGPILFSMANMVKPGIFDLHSFEEFSTVGLSFFLALPTETGSNMDAFEAMLATAKDIASHLGGELKDEQRSVLTGQTIEHYRERIRDFSRRQQLEKNKP